MIGFNAGPSIRVTVRRGVPGPPGPNAANLIAFNDALTMLGVDNVQDAIVALYALIGSGPSPEPPWILATDAWNDNGVWDDAAAWMN